MLGTEQHEWFMGLALQQAALAFDEQEVPVGAIIVAGSKIIAKAYNQTEKLKDVTAHAEMLAITAASEYLGAKYLKGCTLYVTLEPCVMCAGALAWSQIDRIVYAADDLKRGFSQVVSSLLHPKTQVIKGICRQESEELIQSFFKNLRQRM